MQKIKYKTKHKQLAKSLEGLCIEKYESEALNKLLVEFHAIVCKKDEEEIRRSSQLRTLLKLVVVSRT